MEEKLFNDLSNKIRLTVQANYKTIKPFLEQQEELRIRVADLITPILADVNRAAEIARPMITDRIISKRDVVRISLEDRIGIADIVISRLKKRENPIINRDSYHLPKNASWEGLRIKFFDGHTVKVKYPGLPLKTFDYKDIGFKNNKTQNPNLYWTFLKALAENGGTYSISNTFNRQFCRQTKFETAKRLKAFFGLRTDPFHRYYKKEGFKPKFALLDDTDITPLGND